jgi:hypothetical protein
VAFKNFAFFTNKYQCISLLRCKPIKNSSKMEKLSIAFSVFFSITITSAQAQQFVNGDLEGVIHGDANLPPHWLSVPYNDPVCQAEVDYMATPDLTSLTLPEPLAGIIGNPYSGNTFVSGLFGFGHPPVSAVYDEGIMQISRGLYTG